MLLDTNIIVDYLRDKPAAHAFIHGLRGKASISTISVVEVFAGVSSRAEEGRIERLLTGTRILDVNKDIAKIAGQHIRHYQPAHGLDDFDALIAATAEHHGLKLATLNVKHFPMFPRLKAAY